MLYRLYHLLFLCLLGLHLGACSTEDEYSSSPLDNYDALWRILDERYSFFDLKLPPDSSWRDMYDKYRPQIRPQMSSDSLFLVFTQLLGELKDGHVNLTTPFDYGRYWRWKDDYPRNYSADLIEDYLGKDYRIAGGLSYTLLQHHNHTADSIAYLRFPSFTLGLSESNINATLSRLKDCRAIILDIRDNGGGNVTTSERLARHFVKEERIIGSTRHKTGPGHKDFSSPTTLRLSPQEDGIRWLRPIVVLTNRGVYSAANDFVLRLKGLPLVTIMGDKTGGGGGLPLSSELPNGWLVRFSSTQTFDAEGRNIEFGIEPDYYISLRDEDKLRGYDTIIESAVVYIRERYREYKETKVWRK